MHCSVIRSATADKHSIALKAETMIDDACVNGSTARHPLVSEATLDTVRWILFVDERVNESVVRSLLVGTRLNAPDDRRPIGGRDVNGLSVRRRPVDWWPDTPAPRSPLRDTDAHECAIRAVLVEATGDLTAERCSTVDAIAHGCYTIDILGRLHFGGRA